MSARGCCAARAGVAMDDLVYICTKIARQMDAQGLDRIFDAAEAATAAAEEARPLLARVVELVGEVRRETYGKPLSEARAHQHRQRARRERALSWRRGRQWQQQPCLRQPSTTLLGVVAGELQAQCSAGTAALEGQC